VNTKILETSGHLGCEGFHLKLVAESHWWVLKWSVVLSVCCMVFQAKSMHIHSRIRIFLLYFILAAQLQSLNQSIELEITNCLGNVVESRQHVTNIDGGTCATIMNVSFSVEYSAMLHTFVCAVC
jgi:hypothetical protein